MTDPMNPFPAAASVIGSVGSRNVIQNVGAKRIVGTDLITLGKVPQFVYYLVDISSIIFWANDDTDTWIGGFGHIVAGSITQRDSLQPFQGQKFYVVDTDISYEYKGGAWEGGVIEANQLAPTVLFLDTPTTLTKGRQHAVDYSGDVLLPLGADPEGDSLEGHAIGIVVPRGRDVILKPSGADTFIDFNGNTTTSLALQEGAAYEVVFNGLKWEIYLLELSEDIIRSSPSVNMSGLLPATTEDKFLLTANVDRTKVDFPEFTLLFNPDPYLRNSLANIFTKAAGQITLPNTSGVVSYFVSIDNAGVITLEPALVDKESTTKIHLGVVVGNNGEVAVGVDGDVINNGPWLASSDTSTRLREDEIRGGFISASATVGKLKQDALEFLRESVNWEVSTVSPHISHLAARDEINFTYLDRFGVVIGTLQTDEVDGNALDNGSNVNNNDYSIQVVYSSSQGVMGVLKGQESFSNLIEALAVVENYAPIIPPILQDVVELSRWVVRGNQFPGSGSLDLTDGDNFVSVAGSSVGGSSTSNTASNILTDNSNGLTGTNTQDNLNELSTALFTAGDLIAVIAPRFVLANGTVQDEFKEGIIIPIGNTGASSQATYELPAFGLLADSVVKLTYTFSASLNIDSETPLSKTVFIRKNDGSTLNTGITTTFTKQVDNITWIGTAQFTIVGDERAVEFLVLVDAAPSVRTSDATFKITAAAIEIVTKAPNTFDGEQLLAYRELVEFDKTARVHFQKFNEVDVSGAGDFVSIVTAVNAIGAGLHVNKSNTVIVRAGTYPNEVDATTDIDPQNFSNLISRTREQDTVIDGRQSAATPDQDLIETLYLKHSSHIKGITFLAENSRYPLHLESGNSNDRAIQLIEDVTAIHLGADIWASPTAFGIGHHDGQTQTFKRVTGISPTGAFGFHNNKDWVEGAEILIEDSQFTVMGEDDSCISCSSIGAGVMSTATFRNCTINGSMSVINSGWASTNIENQPANRWEYKLIFDNCSPFDWYAPNDEAELFVLQSLNAANSAIVVSGDAVPFMFGKRPDNRKGGVGLPAKLFSYHSVTSATPSIGVTLAERLGNRVILPNLTLNMTLDGGAPIAITIDEDYTGLSNAAVIALLQAKLDTAQGGATGRVFAAGAGEWRHNAPVFQPSREGYAKNADVTALLKGHAVAFSGRNLVLMTNAMGVERFAGIALESAVVGDSLRYQRSGYINEVMFRTFTGGAPTLYDTMEIGATAGIIQVGVTKPLMRLRSEQTFGDTFEFIGREF